MYLRAKLRDDGDLDPTVMDTIIKLDEVYYWRNRIPIEWEDIVHIMGTEQMTIEIIKDYIIYKNKLKYFKETKKLKKDIKNIIKEHANGKD